MRNGRFLVVTRPEYRDVSGETGYCTVRVQDTRWFQQGRYVHVAMSRAECEREPHTFELGGMEQPLNGLSGIQCATSDAYWCFAALNQVRELLSRVDNDERARMAGLERDRQRNLATALSVVTGPRPFVYDSLDGGRWGCARVGQDGSGFGDTEVLACEDVHEGGLNTTIYVAGPYQH